MAKLISASAFAEFLKVRQAAGDGYIMGATGQDPTIWGASSWWFTQYKGADRTKALHWRAHAKRVWDCNGLAEGYYKEQTGIDINTKARYNYSGWCGVRGTGLIPTARRVPGAAVFHSNGLYIHHVGFLVAPVVAGRPEGDWYVIEARGVQYGVVKTRLYDTYSNGKPRWTHWGWMTKYFDYAQPAEPAMPVTPPVSNQPSPPSTMAFPVTGVIPDVSSNQGAIKDFDAFCKGCDFAVFRVIRSDGSVDPQAIRNMSECRKRAFPFGGYIFFKAYTAATARALVRKLVATCAPYGARFLVLDIEGTYPFAAIQAAVDEARKLGVTRLGIYTGSYRWRTRYKKLAGLFDFIWLACYGKNTGWLSNIPDSPCDLHQYTSVATVPGIGDKTCDRSRLTGRKALTWFTGRAYTGVEYWGVVRTTGSVNVRSARGTASSKLGVAPKGTLLERRGNDVGGWTPIRYMGKEAWASAQYVKAVSEK